jgi:hypothetical protein
MILEWFSPPRPIMEWLYGQKTTVAEYENVQTFHVKSIFALTSPPSSNPEVIKHKPTLIRTNENSTNVFFDTGAEMQCDFSENLDTITFSYEGENQTMVITQEDTDFIITYS